MATPRSVVTIVLLAGLMFCLSASQASAELRGKVFGVKPGMTIQSSYFGLEFTRLQPFIGLDWVGVAVTSDDNDVSASVFIPHLGTKLFLSNYGVEHTVAPYFLGDWFFSTASVNADQATGAEENAVKDVLEFWGLGFGFGAEYFFSESFSVGGEYGVRYLHDKVDEHSDTYEYSPGYPSVQKVNNEFTLAFKVTYAVLSVNYHFGKKK